MRRTKKETAVWRREKKEGKKEQQRSGKQSARKEADLLGWDPPPGVHMAAAP